MESATRNSEPRTIGDDATFTTPRFINGLPVRRREEVNAWHVLGVVFGSVLVPDIVVLLAMIPFVVRRILKYLDARAKPVGRPDVLK